MRRAALVVLAALVLVAPAPSRRADAVAPHVGAVGATAVTVARAERSITFHPDVRGFEKVPDGHALEVLWFPPGKGAAKWQRRDALFLGIDHTAIVVGDTARSLACYRDALGLVVAGESENWGPEQERLNNVAGARLRITTL